MYQDSLGQKLEIGDAVLYRRHGGHSFDKYGIFIGVLPNTKTPNKEGKFYLEISYKYGVREKYPRNVKRLSNEDAMLWKLENS